MSESLDAWSIVLSASVPVQLVMLVLLGFSFFSWVVIFQRMRILSYATKSLAHFEGRFWSGVDLRRLYMELNNENEVHEGQEGIFMAGFKEFARLRQVVGQDATAIMEGCQRSMKVVLVKEQNYLEKHLPFLATVGSISPYIGLLGTVWGIMNSFLSLAQQNQVTLQVVAPDIAEALLATAMGLFAAIPAVMAYNRFVTKSETLVNQYQTFSEEFSSILHRKVHELVV